MFHFFTLYSDTIDSTYYKYFFLSESPPSDIVAQAQWSTTPLGRICTSRRPLSHTAVEAPGHNLQFLQKKVKEMQKADSQFVLVFPQSVLILGQ